MFIKIVSVSLRLLTLAVKFIFVIFIAKFISTKDMANYGYIMAIIGYMIYAVGFEFYTYSNRILICAKEEELYNLIWNQQVFYLIVYIAALPLLFFAMLSFSFSPFMSGLVCTLVFLEHICQEWNRILISLGKSLEASVVLFLRGGAWSIAVILIMFLYDSLRNLDVILVGWIIGLMLPLYICLLETLKLRKKSKGIFTIDLLWIKKGILVSISLFIASLAIKATVTFDRFFIGDLGGEEVVAAYVIYISISNAILSSVDAAVVSFMFPSIIKSAHQKNKTEFDQICKIFLIRCMGIALFFAVGVALLIEPMMDVFQLQQYVKHVAMVNWILLYVVITVAALPFHLGLYSFNEDKIIMKISILSAVVFFIMSGYFMINNMPPISIIYAVVIASLIVLSLKYYYFNKSYKKWFQ